MAIETTDKQDEKQQELQVESREEKLEKLFQLDQEIEELRSSKEAASAQASSYGGKIKEKEQLKKDLLFKLNNRQETVVPVAVDSESEETHEDVDVPTDAELEAFGEPEEGETPKPSTVLEEIENLSAPDHVEDGENTEVGEQSDNAHDAEPSGSTTEDSAVGANSDNEEPAA